MNKIIAFNYKAYAQSFGESALHLSQAARVAAARHASVDVIICPPASELRVITSALRSSAASAQPAPHNFFVFAQHAHAVDLGAHTGSLPLEALKLVGASGTLVNHAEKKLPHDVVRAVCAKARALELRTIACADSLAEARALARFPLAAAPWAIAVEPPELIGLGVSVSTAKPDVVKGAVAEIKNFNSEIRVLVGAGVSNAEDVRKSMQLGAEGVLLASAFVKASNPTEFAESLVAALG